MNATMAVTASPQTSAQGSRFAANSITWPILGLILVLIMQFTMVFTRAVNWDEFWFYYHVTEFARGNLTQPLQSLHVRLFAWLPGITGNTIDKIVIARIVMLGCETLTMGAIYAIARRFAGKPEALLAALAYVTAGFVLQHGFSFRTDPMATAALMWALVVLLRSRFDPLAISTFALLVALAGMITMKIVLYAPAFLGIAWLRWSESGFSKAMATRLLAAAATTIACFTALYWWHSQSLTVTTSGTGMASSASRWMFFLGVPPYWQMILKAAAFSPLMVAQIIFAPALTRKATLSGAEKIALAGLWLPVLTPAFYTNTAGYFYVFMLAPVAAGCILAMSAATRRYSIRLAALTPLLLAAGVFLLEDREVMQRQRAIAATAEEVLPHGIAYFDHNGMLPIFDKANYLMTPSAITDYRLAGVAAYRAEMERRPIPLLLVNNELIEKIMDGSEEVLLPNDTRALRGTYQPFWGPLYLAGLDLKAGADVEHEFLVPGTYTVQGSSIEIDTVRYSPGDLVEISRGSYPVHAPMGNTRLQWGPNLSPPSQPWDDGPIYVEF